MTIHEERAILQDYLNNNSLFSDYAEFLGTTSSRLKEFFFSEAKLFNKDFAAFYAFTGLSPKHLGIDREMKFFSQNSTDHYEFLSFSDWVKKNQDGQGFIQEYFDKIIEIVKMAKDRIFVFDYLINNSETLAGPYKKTYHGGYLDYFKAIENMVTTKRLKYTRVLGFPPGGKTFAKGDNQNSNPELRHITAALNLLFDKTFDHLCRLFRDDAIELFVLPVAPRNYSIMFIDNRYVLTEYFRVRKDRKAVPDLLFVNPANPFLGDNGNRLLTVYETEFDELIGKQRAIKVDAGLFSSCFQTWLETVREDIAQLKSQDRNPDNLLKLGKLETREKLLANRVKTLLFHGLC